MTTSASAASGRVVEGGKHAATSRARRSRTALDLVGALLVGSGAALLWFVLFPTPLPQTDIVGYPIHRNFNIERYFDAYGAVTFVFPAATLVSYWLLGWLLGRSNQSAGRPDVRRDHRVADEPPAVPVPGRGARVARATVVGAVLGLASAYVTDRLIGVFWPIALLVTATYLGMVAIVARVLALRRSGTTYWSHHAAVNALLAPLSCAALYGVSQATHVFVVADGRAVHYPWLPLWIAATLTVAAVAWVAIRLWRSKGRERAIARVERDAIVLVAGPVLLLLITARLPGALGRMDVFHEGEGLAGAYLTEAGRFPWRDLYFIHGPLPDIFASFPGTAVFENSRWGITAGWSVLLAPSVLAGFYLLHAKLMRGDWIYLAITPAAMLGVDSRSLVVALALLLLIGALRKPSPVRALVLGAFVVAQSILAPETAPFALAAAIVLVWFEIHYREPGHGIVASFPRVIWFSIGGLITAAVWAAYLASHSALDDFLSYYVVFARSHELTGGLPFQISPMHGTGLYLFAAIAPVAAVGIFAAFFAVQRRRDRLRVEDWGLLTLSLFIVYFYRKFLSRAADQHVFQVLGMSVPLILYLVYRGIGAFEESIRRRATPAAKGALVRRRPLSVALLVTVLLASPHAVVSSVKSLPDHFRARSPEHPWLSPLGYALDDAIDQEGFEDLKTALAALPNPNGRIFDFTNQPGVFHYLLRYQPATRYYHVSMAIRRNSQRDLLRELRQDPPGIVVTLATDGQPAWDLVPNYVRHYEVSDFLLDHYRPVIWTGGNLLLLRTDLDSPPGWPSGLHFNTPPLFDDLYFLGFPCDWGFAPNFLELNPPPAEAGAANLSVRPMPGPGPSIELRLPQGFRRYDWLEIRTASSLRTDAFILSDGGVGDGRTITFQTLASAGQRYLVRVGSCPQWRGYTSGRVFLQHDQPQGIVAVRLLRSGPEVGSA